MQALAGLKNHHEPVHVFAYGSLIWRPDFEFEAAYQAIVPGYERRFWQASHDHRGTVDSPGRVVTLVPVSGGHCAGVVYQLPDEGRDEILAALDKREQDGYQRVWLPANRVRDGQSMTTLTWLAAEGNPSWVGDQSMDDLARLIHHRRGPSGTNLEYLLRLHEALADQGIQDTHVESLVLRIQNLSG
ncbi:MAG: gamma-glutamylcyclotransferase [Granulosicoccus sp.]